MANQLYGSVKEDFLNGSINLLSADLRVALVTSGYTVDVNNHQFVSDIGISNIVARSAQLENVSIVNGVFDASNQTMEDYGTSGFDYIVIYESTGNDSTSRLLAYIDTGPGLPVENSPDPISIIIQWSDLVSKIFSL